MPKHGKKVLLLGMASVAAAESELVNMTGKSLAVTWKDCADSTTHTKVTDVEPKSLPLGTSTTLTGTGALDEAITGGTFEIDVNTALPSQKFTGDMCQSKTFALPLGVGSVTWSGLKCPLAAGTLQVPLVVKLSSFLPAALATADITATAKATSGDKVLCLSMHLAEASQDVHPERIAQIEEIQNTPGVLWQAAAHPRFASQAPGASSDMMGVKGDQKKAVADLVAKGEVVYDDSANSNSIVPDSFDSAQQWPHCAKMIDDIRDQSNCGCCWAFAGAEAASDRMCIATNGTKMVPLSAQDICFNSGGLLSHGCSGGQISTPWSYLKKGSWFGGKGAVSGGQYQGSGPFGKGLCSDFSLPHCHHHGPQGSDPFPAEGAPGCPSQSTPSGPRKCDADAEAPHNDFAADKYSYTGNTVTASGEEDMQKAIMAGGPMEVAFTVYSDFENYASGIYHHVTGSMAGGHAVKVVGWGVEGGVKYWKIANSWNPYWGEKGYFRIKRGNNEGGIEDQAVASAPDAMWSRAGDSVEVNMIGGALSITWQDCGDASTHSKVTDFEPKTLPLGAATALTGTGNLDEAITGGNFEIDMKTSIISPKWTGDICQAKTFNLPLGLGSVTWSGLKCPLAAGTVQVPLEVKLSGALPASMATARISTTATATNGDKILCLNLHLAKAGDYDEVVV